MPRLLESRFVINQDDAGRLVIGIDSASLFRPEDAGQIVVTASHCALVRDRPDKVVFPGVFTAFFHDAGGVMEGSGYSRLAALDGAAVIAATVSADSARVGDARSCYQDGVPSHPSDTAHEQGARVRMMLRTFINALRPA